MHNYTQKHEIDKKKILNINNNNNNKPNDRGITEANRKFLKFKKKKLK